MTSAHAEPLDFDEVKPGHSVTVHRTGRPALRLVTITDWAIAELSRVFVAFAPLEALDPSTGLATGREPGDVYSQAFRAVGCSVADAEERAIQLVRAADEILAELYDALGPDVLPVPVVPQLRADLVERAHSDRVSASREAGWPDDWVNAVAAEPGWLHAHPAGR